jgi:DNA-binding Lrp family transcriptional regulator
MKILGLIEQNKQTTIPELAEIIEISERVVQKNIKKLKEKGVLARLMHVNFIFLH